GVFVRANDHFLRSAARGDEADSRFDEAEVGFGGGVNARAVQADFAAASQGEALGRDHYWARRVLDGEINVLELAHGEVEVVPFLLLGSDEQEHQVGAHGKIHGLVGDDHGLEISTEALEAGVQHGGDVAADGVHLGVKFAAEDAIAQVDEAGAGIRGDFPGLVLERFEDDDAGRLARFGEGAGGQVEDGNFAV